MILRNLILTCPCSIIYNTERVRKLLRVKLFLNLIKKYLKLYRDNVLVHYTIFFLLTFKTTLK